MDTLQDYCKTSTLYVVRYIGDPKKTWLERFMWVTVLLFASFNIAFYVYSDWLTMRRGPLQVSVYDTRISVGHLDFPAVTLCADNPVHPRKLASLKARVLGSSPSKEDDRRFTATLRALILTAEPSWHAGYKYLLRRNITPFPIRSEDIVPFLKYVTPSLSDMFVECFWGGTTYRCDDIMRHQVTECGFCFSFNSYTSLRRSNDSDRNPPFKNLDGTMTGLKTNSEGRTSAFEAFLAPEIVTSYGHILYWLSVDNPRSIPLPSEFFPLRVLKNMVHRLEVQVEVNALLDTLDNMDRDALPCNPDSHGTVTNCQMGCRMRHIWRHCRCVVYSHALIYNNESIPICGVKEMQCLAEHSSNLNIVKLVDQEDSRGMDCNCKPPCNAVDYITKIKVMPRDAGVIQAQYSVYIDVFYFSKWAVGYTSRTKISWKDLFASLGGTSGFYLGASIISFIEIFVIIIKIIISSFKCTSVITMKKHFSKHTKTVKKSELPFLN